MKIPGRSRADLQVLAFKDTRPLSFLDDDITCVSFRLLRAHPEERVVIYFGGRAGKVQCSSARENTGPGHTPLGSQIKVQDQKETEGTVIHPFPPSFPPSLTASGRPQTWEGSSGYTHRRSGMHRHTQVERESSYPPKCSVASQSRHI